LSDLWVDIHSIVTGATLGSFFSRGVLVILVVFLIGRLLCSSLGEVDLFATGTAACDDVAGVKSCEVVILDTGVYIK